MSLSSNIIQTILKKSKGDDCHQIQKIENQIDKIDQKLNSLSNINRFIDEIKIQNGEILTNLNLNRINVLIKDLHKAEFKVFSQWGDDGIIQFLINYLKISSKTFIEFGVENYQEANTRFLLIHDNWKGLVIDGSEQNINYLKQTDVYWKYNLIAVCSFITAENIKEIIIKNGFKKDVGILHIDIDGNDYWVWKSIDFINPTIVIIEYNSVFGPDKTWTIPYDPNFNRTNAHYSNLYFGSSLLSLCDLAEEKGYCFIGSNSAGNNAYFVRKNKRKNLPIKTLKNGYVDSQFRQSRDKNGCLTYINENARLKAIKGLRVYNTRTKKIETITTTKL